MGHDPHPALPSPPHLLLRSRRDSRPGRPYWAMALLAVLAGLSATVSACRTIPSKPPAADVTVCELLRHPAPYDGRIVRVSGLVIFALADSGPFLFDRSCRGGIDLDVRNPPSAENKVGLTKYEQMFRRGTGEFDARFEGRFQRDTKDILGLHLHWWPGTRLGLRLTIYRALYIGPYENPPFPDAR